VAEQFGRRFASLALMVLAVLTGAYLAVYFLAAAFVDAVFTPRQPVGTPIFISFACLPLVAGRFIFRRSRIRGRPGPFLRASIAFALTAVILFMPVLVLSAGVP
jgi:hypothetical protein